MPYEGKAARTCPQNRLPWARDGPYDHVTDGVPMSGLAS
jgi:hypothetical protein